MNKLLRKTATGIATAALLANAFAPLAFATVSVEISGNGASSDNDTHVTVSNSSGVTQSNIAEIQNNVSIGANSGGNTANYNTGGNVSVDTGSASSNVSVNNTANSNTASVDGCCAGNVEVKVSGNGADSDNDAKVGVMTGSSVAQSNIAEVVNNVSSNLNTGDNKAKYNTGGDVEIETGNAEGTVDLSTEVNKNVAKVTGDGSGTLGVWISGNGANSDNDAKVFVASSNLVQQSNLADIANDVEMWANSGHNSAKYNTGGDVSIDTGNAGADVSIANMANFNSADVDSCGCEISGTVKVKDNGYDSDNDANVVLKSMNWTEQANLLECSENDDACASVSVGSNTGDNSAKYNTQGGEPSISTGDAGGDVTVENTANQNVVGNVDMGEITIPAFNFNGGNISGLLVMLLGLFSGQTV